MVPAPQYPPLVAAYEPPVVMTVAVVVALVATVVFVWCCLGAPAAMRRAGRAPVGLLVGCAVLAVSAGVVGYVADRDARADHARLEARWHAESERVRAATVAALEREYGVEVVDGVVPDVGSFPVEVRLADGRVTDDCTLDAQDGVLELHCA